MDAFLTFQELPFLFIFESLHHIHQLIERYQVELSPNVQFVVEVVHKLLSIEALIQNLLPQIDLFLLFSCLFTHQIVN